MNYQKETPKEVVDILDKAGIKYADFDYYAFPETFASTSGPHGGIGGSALTTFTVEAYVCDGIGPTVYVCDGRHKLVKGQYKGRWNPL